MDKEISKLIKIIKRAGKMMLTGTDSNKEISYKEGIENIVTNYDISIQNYLCKSLLKLYADANFIGEENYKNESIKKKGYTFIVDPIDGTNNFARDIKLSAISICLLKDGKQYIGVCYLPYNNELYYAKKGKGAYLNNKLIHVSDKKIENGILLAGNAPYYKNLRDKSIETFCKLSKITSDYRRLGSAVIELCYIASGKAEVYFEYKLRPWDYAAASLIVTEAGGVITDMEGNNLIIGNDTSVLASNGTTDIIKIIK